MKIEKKKVHRNVTFSSSAKATIAASLGVAASFALSACISDSNETDSEVPKDPEPLCGIVECGYGLSSSSEAIPNSSSETVPSSSSKVIDIPQSGEHYSSSVIEALSSSSQPVARPISSFIPGGVPLISSPSTVPPSSSSAKPASSSSETQSSSSSENGEIKVYPKKDSTLIPTVVPVIKDTLIPNIHLCEDPYCQEKNLIQSMVTTLEADDIA